MEKLKDKTEIISWGYQQPIMISENGKNIVKKIDIAMTLLARDYKGFSTYGSNAVLVIRNERKDIP